MDIITPVIVLVILGVALYLIETYVPIRVIVILALVLYLLRAFGISGRI
jgi:hypothetical protein